jgi:hypothetical protein
MRPLIRPEWRSDWAERRPADVALAALGRFCAACERRLPQEAVAWHVSRGQPIEDGLTRDDWPDTIPLCHNCAWAAQQSQAAVGDVLIPDRDLTFTLDEASPFHYERASVNGAERIVAAPGNDRARATADYFALNEHRPALGGQLDLEPGDDVPTRDFIDPRLELRTRAWDSAHTAVRQIGAADADRRNIVVQLTRALADETGFWSTWATVLWHELSDRAVLGQVLRPFPATRRDWLPPSADSGA